MKKKSSKIRWIIITLEAAFLIAFLFSSNHMAFGVWNPLSIPERINLVGRNYHISNLDPVSFTDSEVPQYPIKTWVWTGKWLYSNEQTTDSLPTVIYLKLANGKYQSYALSGSN